MGILVHRSFPDEKANGVAITRNIYNPNLSAYTINVQVDEISVVNPPQGYTADQFLFYITPDAYTNPAIEYISHSNATGGESVLSQDEIVLLYRRLEKIHMIISISRFSKTVIFLISILQWMLNLKSIKSKESYISSRLDPTDD